MTETLYNDDDNDSNKKKLPLDAEEHGDLGLQL